MTEIPAGDAHSSFGDHYAGSASAGSVLPFSETHTCGGDRGLVGPLDGNPQTPPDEAQAWRGDHGQVGPSDGVPDIINAIVAHHRMRNYWMEYRKRNTNSLGAALRIQMGWTLALPADQRKAIEARAQEVITLGERYLRDAAKAAKKAGGGEDRIAGGDRLPAIPFPPALAPYAETVLITLELSKRPLEAEATHAAEMERLAQLLPVWPLVRDWPHFGALALAIIVAEAPGATGHGLADFATKGKLYKRLGLAVIDGVRQGGLTKAAPKPLWKAHGYSRVRRSRIWTATTWLVVKNPRYREIYLDRKEYERVRAEAEGLRVLPAAKIAKGKAGECRTLGHIDRRARRFAEKHFIADLWHAWRQADQGFDRFAEAAE